MPLLKNVSRPFDKAVKFNQFDFENHKSKRAEWICLSFSQTQRILSLLIALMIGNSPFPRSFFIPLGVITTISPLSTQAYIFLPFIDSIVQFLPLPNSFSSFPGSHA